MLKSSEHAAQGFKMLIEQRKSDFSEYFDDLEKADLFQPEQNPEEEKAKKGEGFIIPFWGALPYLKAVAELAGKKDDTELANKVLNVIRNVTNEKVNGEPKNNYHTWRVFAETLVLLPNHAIKIEDIDLITVWLSSKFDRDGVVHVIGSGLLPKLLKSSEDEDAAKAHRAFYHCMAIKWVKKNHKETEEPVSVASEHWLRELLEKNAESLGRRCGEEAANMLLQKLRDVYKKLEGDIPSWSTRPAIEDHPQNHTWRGIENFVVVGLRDAVSAWIDEDSASAKKFVKNMLSGDLVIERRIGIYLLNKHLELLEELFDLSLPLINSTAHLHEMYVFLEERFSSFNTDRKNRVLEQIKNLPNPKKDSDDHILHQRLQRRWLSAIKGKGLELADKFYNELNSKKELGGEYPYPSFISYTSSMHGPGPSEFDAVELLSFLDDGTLVKKLNEFEEKDSWRGPTIRSLADELSEAVKKDTLKFALSLDDLMQVKRPYQYALISGFKKGWLELDKAQVDQWSKVWNPVISFIGNILLEEKFWTERAEEDENLTPNKNWMPSLVADFLENIVKSDDKSLPVEFLPRVLVLIQTLLERLPIEAWNEGSSDPMTKSINAPRGQAIEALINYALFTARLSDRENGEHESSWGAIEPLFNKELEASNGNNFEFSTLMGAYCLNMYYLSPKWVEYNILNIFPLNYEENFVCAISGLAYSQAHQKIYSLLKDNGIIEKALTLDIDKRSAREQLIERVCLGYLWEEESLDSPRFKLIFESESDLINAVNFFWRVHHDNLSKKQIDMVLDFLRFCVALIEREKIVSERFNSNLLLLARYLTEINEEQKLWLLALAPYAEHDYNAYRLIEDLERLVSKNPDAVQDILVVLLANYSPYSDFEGRIMNIVKALKENNVSPELLKIVDKLRYLDGFPKFYEEITT